MRFRHWPVLFGSLLFLLALLTVHMPPPTTHADERGDCRCATDPQPSPSLSLNDWLVANDCDPQQLASPVVLEFFRPWIHAGGITKDMVDAAEALDSRNLRVRVVDGKMFTRGKFGNGEGIVEQLLDVLMQVHRRARLPELDLVLSSGDWPVSRDVGSHGKGPPPPVLSFCRTNGYVDIPISYGDIQTLEPSHWIPWHRKLPKLVWRGALWPHEQTRQRIMRWADSPLLDVGFTHRGSSRIGDLSDVPHGKPPLTALEQQKYAFVAHLPGNCASTRLRTQLSGSSLVFKVDSPDLEFFYPMLRPWTHYVPFSLTANATNLNARVGWALDNPAAAQQIVRNAQVFARDYLLKHRIPCYTGAVLRQYAQLQNFRPTMPVTDTTKDEWKRNWFVRRCQCDDQASVGRWVRE